MLADREFFLIYDFISFLTFGLYKYKRVRGGLE
jgi:hypothetical protein